MGKRKTDPRDFYTHMRNYLPIYIFIKTRNVIRNVGENFFCKNIIAQYYCLKKKREKELNKN